MIYPADVAAGRRRRTACGLALPVLLLLAPTFAGAQNTTPRPKMPAAVTIPPANAPVVKLPPNIVARVGSRDITREDALAMFDMVNGRPIVTQMVQAQVLRDEAKRLGVVITDAELKQAVQEAKDRIVTGQMQMGKPMTYAEIAARDGISDDLVRWSVQLDLLRRKTFTKSLAAQVPPLSQQVKLAHILIATIPLGAPGEEVKPLSPADQAKKDADAKAKIAGILADINSKKITFDEAAKQFSEDRSNSANGGVLPFAARGQFDPSFEQAAFAIKTPGEVVGPVKSQFGWHLIKLVARGKDATPAEKAAYQKGLNDRIEQQMANQQVMQGWFNSLMEKARVVINPTARIVPGAKSPVQTLGASRKAASAK